MQTENPPDLQTAVECVAPVPVSVPALPAAVAGPEMVQIELDPSNSTRAKIKALRFFADAADLLGCSADADPEVRSVVCAMQASMERAALNLELRLRHAQAA